MKSMVYDRKVDTRDPLLQRIFNPARGVNDVAFLCNVTFSIVQRVRMCNQADAGHFEHLVH
jgi:hypothetical protein